jgi:hypothetical protein
LIGRASVLAVFLALTSLLIADRRSLERERFLFGWTVARNCSAALDRDCVCQKPLHKGVAIRPLQVLKRARARANVGIAESFCQCGSSRGAAKGRFDDRIGYFAHGAPADSSPGRPGAARMRHGDHGHRHCCHVMCTSQPRGMS